MLRVIIDVLKVVVGMVTELPLSMLIAVKSVTLSWKTIGGRKVEVEIVGSVVLVFEIVVVNVVGEESVDNEVFFISSTYKVVGIDEIVADCVDGGALVDVLVGSFVTVGAFVGFFVAGLRVDVAATVDMRMGASVGEVTVNVV